MPTINGFIQSVLRTECIRISFIPVVTMAKLRSGIDVPYAVTDPLEYLLVIMKESLTLQVRKTITT